jgi:hypothetical protein
VKGVGIIKINSVVFNYVFCVAVGCGITQAASKKACYKNVVG